MTRLEFDRFIADCRSRGFNYVKTSGGQMPLEDWRPYGSFDGGNPGIEKYIGGFEWLDDNQVADYPAEEPHATSFTGVWTLC